MVKRTKTLAKKRAKKEKKRFFNIFSKKEKNILKRNAKSKKKILKSRKGDYQHKKTNIKTKKINLKLPKKDIKPEKKKGIFSRIFKKKRKEAEQLNLKQKEEKVENLKKRFSSGMNLTNTKKPQKKKNQYFNYESREKILTKTNIKGFDALFENGIPQGSSILIAGGPGCGKTLFCLNVLMNHVKSKKKGLYMSFEEPEWRLRQHMKDFGWNSQEYEKKRLMLIKRFDPFDITRSVEALLTKAKRELLIDVHPVFFPQNFNPSLIILDSMSAVAAAFVGREDSYRIYIEQLFRFFENIGATSLLITETESTESLGLTRSGVEGFLADGIILMHSIKKQGIRLNGIEVLKMRGAHFQKKVAAFKLKPGKGIEIDPNKVVSLT